MTERPVDLSVAAAKRMLHVATTLTTTRAAAAKLGWSVDRTRAAAVALATMLGEAVRRAPMDLSGDHEFGIRFVKVFTLASADDDAPRSSSKKALGALGTPLPRRTRRVYLGRTAGSRDGEPEFVTVYDEPPRVPMRRWSRWRHMGSPRPKTYDGDRLRWAQAVREVAPMRHRTPLKGRSVSPEGDALAAPWRLHVDGAVFRQTKGRRGGAVLIDASGSMHLSAEDVQSVVSLCPAGVVAAYGGEGARGTIRILARDGVMATHPSAFEFHTGNCVDGPALRWLACQPGPRVWISDGIVTGVNDLTADNLDIEVERLCERHRISRVETLAAAFRILG